MCPSCGWEIYGAIDLKGRTGELSLGVKGICPGCGTVLQKTIEGLEIIEDGLLTVNEFLEVQAVRKRLQNGNH